MAGPIGVSCPLRTAAASASPIATSACPSASALRSTRFVVSWTPARVASSSLALAKGVAVPTRSVQLSWAQASKLAGLVQAPSAYDPIDHMSTGRLRQRHVLNRLVATKVLSPAQADTAFAAPLGPVSYTHLRAHETDSY